MVTTTSKPELITADQLLHLQEDGVLYELEQERLICMSPSAFLPGVVGGLLFGLLYGWVKPRTFGVCGSGDVEFRLTSDPDTVRAPDVWFVRTDRIPPKEAQLRFFPGTPAWPLRSSPHQTASIR